MPATPRAEAVNVWTEAGLGPVPPAPMTPDSLLWLPADHVPGTPRPAVVVAHAWTGYPYDPFPRALGPALAGRGLAVLSLCLRRRGVEGALAAMPDDDLRDLRLGIDALATRGLGPVVLVGEEVGALSVTRYAAQVLDARVRGVALVDAPPDLPDWFADAVGDAAGGHLRTAGLALRQLKPAATVVDVELPGPGSRPSVWVHQLPGPFLSWWGPRAATRLSRLLPDVAVPVLRAASGSDVVEQVGRWAASTLPPAATPATLEVVSVTTDDDSELAGYLRVPDGAGDTAVLTVHGMAQGPFSAMATRFAPAWMDAGLANLAIETRRSGFRGVARSVPETDVADIDAFVELLLARGFRQVVLVGASLGSQAISRYQGERHHPAVAAAVHLAPTEDCPAWAVRAVGAAHYARCVEQATAAVAAGRGDRELVVADFTAPPPAHFAPTMRLRQTARSWLGWWGPDATTVHTTLIADVDVPVLLMSGTEDEYNTPARMDTLQAAAARSPVVEQRWYDDCDHDFGGFERRAVEDAVDWLRKTGVLAS